MRLRLAALIGDLPHSYKVESLAHNRLSSARAIRRNRHRESRISLAGWLYERDDWLAGFQVILTDRFWVIAEEIETRYP
jgi:hypothetical protein